MQIHSSTTCGPSIARARVSSAVDMSVWIVFLRYNMRGTIRARAVEEADGRTSSSCQRSCLCYAVEAHSRSQWSGLAHMLQASIYINTAHALCGSVLFAKGIRFRGVGYWHRLLRLPIGIEFKAICTHLAIGFWSQLNICSVGSCCARSICGFGGRILQDRNETFNERIVFTISSQKISTLTSSNTIRHNIYIYIYRGCSLPNYMLLKFNCTTMASH